MSSTETSISGTSKKLPLCVKVSQYICMWFVTQDSDIQMRYRDDMSCLYGCSELFFMIVVRPLSRILLCPTSWCFCVWDVLTGFSCFLGSLWRLTFCYSMSCILAAKVSLLMLWFFGCSKISLREFMLFATPMIWWYFMLFWPLRDVLMKCDACWPCWDFMRFPHAISCFFFYPPRDFLRRYYALFAA